jgi:hypothetical protein
MAFEVNDKVKYIGPTTATLNTDDEGTVVRAEDTVGSVLVDFYGDEELIHRDQLQKI